MQLSSSPLLELHGHSMGTTWSLRAVSPPFSAPEVHHAIQTTLDNIVAQMSHWEPDSLLSRINRAPAGWYQVPPEFFTVIACALDIACKTGGACDPTVGELVQLWGFGAGSDQISGQIFTPPDPQCIAAARARAGWKKLHVKAGHSGIWQPGGLSLDFSAIAKGYGVDAMAGVLACHGFEHYLVELGGELRAGGHRPDGEPWRVQIEAPDSSTGGNTGAGLPIALHNLAIATSGDTRRYFMHGGRRYAHTIDPRTGWALDNDLASVSVLHPQCMVADALSTALICMGWEAGQAFAREHDIAAMFMRRGGGRDDAVRIPQTAEKHTDIAVAWTDAFFRQAHPDAAHAALPA